MIARDCENWTIGRQNFLQWSNERSLQALIFFVCSCKGHVPCQKYQIRGRSTLHFFDDLAVHSLSEILFTFALVNVRYMKPANPHLRSPNTRVQWDTLSAKTFRGQS